MEKFDKEQLEKQALGAIQSDSDIVFIQDVIAVLPCSSATFYNHNLEKLETIKDALHKNRIEIKKRLRTNWMRQDENATMQVALYKLLSNDEEKDSLTMQKTDITTKGDRLNSVIIEVIDGTTDKEQ